MAYKVEAYEYIILNNNLTYKSKVRREIVTKQIITGLISNGADVDVVGYVRPDETNLSLPTNYNVAEARVIETQGHKKETLKWLLSSLVKRYHFHLKNMLALSSLK
ncbi:hypothetical protein ABVN74_14930 [Escherichia coli]